MTAKCRGVIWVESWTRELTLTQTDSRNSTDSRSLFWMAMCRKLRPLISNCDRHTWTTNLCTACVWQRVRNHSSSRTYQPRLNLKTPNKAGQLKVAIYIHPFIYIFISPNIGRKHLALLDLMASITCSIFSHVVTQRYHQNHSEKGENINIKCTKKCLVAGLYPDSLKKLKALPRTLGGFKGGLGPQRLRRGKTQKGERDEKGWEVVTPIKEINESFIFYIFFSKQPKI